jgi:hypothetical protein
VRPIPATLWIWGDLVRLPFFFFFSPLIDGEHGYGVFLLVLLRNTGMARRRLFGECPEARLTLPLAEREDAYWCACGVVYILNWFALYHI